MNQPSPVCAFQSIQNTWYQGTTQAKLNCGTLRHANHSKSGVRALTLKIYVSVMSNTVWVSRVTREWSRHKISNQGLNWRAQLLRIRNHKTKYVFYKMVIIWYVLMICLLDFKMCNPKMKMILCHLQTRCWIRLILNLNYPIFVTLIVKLKIIINKSTICTKMLVKFKCITLI